MTPDGKARGTLLLLLWLTQAAAAAGGPYSRALKDPTNPWDAPVPGFVGPAGEGKAALPNGSGGVSNAGNQVNPLFFGWATVCEEYAPPAPDTVSGDFDQPALGLGPVTGDPFDIVSLGDQTAAQMNAGGAPGSITLGFARLIKNKPGADLVVYENGFVSGVNTGGAGIGGVFAELAYVEVSSDGIAFARFPSVSLTPASVGSYGAIDPGNVFGLAGKHANANGDSWGTPFDLDALSADPLVKSGAVDLNAIAHVRLVDVPGNGFYRDTAGRPIYDAWFTYGSGGFDLEAVGVISQETAFDEWQTVQGLTGAQRGAGADPDGDGIPNLLEYAFGTDPLTPGSPPIAAAAASDRAGISFPRDTRKVDLTYEVQASADLRGWTTIARSVGGASLGVAAPYAPAIDDRSDSAIASVGVIRRETVFDVVSFAQAPRRFLRVEVTRTP